MQFRRHIHFERASLWKHADFRNLWTAETVSAFGNHIGAVAIPLVAALALDATPFQMGLLSASATAPRLVVGIFAGAWVDRWPRVPVMVAMDLGRFVTNAMIPIMFLTGHLTIEVLMVLAFLSGTQSVFFDSAWSAVLPHLVARRNLPDANSLLMGSQSLAQVVGPALAGALVGWIGGPRVMGITAVGFAISAWFIRQIRYRDKRDHFEPDQPRALMREVREGFEELWRSEVVRPLTTSAAVLNFGGFIFLSVYVLYMTRDLGLSERGVGLVYACGGVGALIGTMLAPVVANRVGVGRSVLFGAVGFGIANFPVVLAIAVPQIALPLVIVAEFGAWLSLMVYNVNRFSLRQALTPDRLLGRVSSSTMTIVGGAITIGSLVGGAIGSAISVHAALIVGVVLMFLAAWWVWDSPVPGIVEMPGSDEEREETSVTQAEAMSPMRSDDS